MPVLDELTPRLVPVQVPSPTPAGRGGVQIVRSHQEPFEGTVARHRFGGVTVSLVKGGPRELVRPGRLIDGTGGGVLRVCRPLTGEIWVFQDGRHGVVRSPHLVCFDSARPYKVIMPESFRMVEVAVSHHLLGITAQDAQRLTAEPWRGDRGLAALLSALLDGLGRHGKEVDTAVDLLGGSLVGLTAALFSARMNEVAEDSEVARQALMLRVQAHVRDHLADHELSPVSIARRHNISLRYLQKIFQEFGISPARWIRDERLARCRSELADAALDHLPVALIGERAGLYGASHLSRLFRDRYGTTPRDFRKERTDA